MGVIPDCRESEIVKRDKQELFDHLQKRAEMEPVKKLPRLSKEVDSDEISELKGLKAKLRAIIDGDIDGPLSEYEHKRKGQLEKKYKYHTEYLMW